MRDIRPDFVALHPGLSDTIQAHVSPGHHNMSNADTVIQDLVIANRILAKEDVVDAYGHISIRHPDNPKHFSSPGRWPDLVERGDIVELGLDGQPVRDETRSLYLERFIHAAIYEARPDIQSVVTPTPRTSCRSALPRRRRSGR